MSVFVFKHIGKPESCFDQISLTYFDAGCQTLTEERVFGFHSYDTIEGIRPVKGRTGAYNEVYFLDIEF